MVGAPGSPFNIITLRRFSPGDNKNNNNDFSESSSAAAAAAVVPDEVKWLRENQ